MHDRDAWGDSLPLLKRLIDEQPKSPELLALRSHAYSHLERPSEALADGEQAVKLGPTVAEAYLRRGEAYSAQGKHQLAIADYDQAIKLNPKEDEAYANRAAALANAGQNEKALESANRALAMRTDRYEYWLVRGEIHAVAARIQGGHRGPDPGDQAAPAARDALSGASEHVRRGEAVSSPRSRTSTRRCGSIPTSPTRWPLAACCIRTSATREAAKADLYYALRLRPGQKEWTAFLQRIEAEPPSGRKAREHPPAGGAPARLLLRRGATPGSWTTPWQRFARSGRPRRASLSIR